MRDGRHLERHLTSHSSEARYVCQICGFKYFSSRGLKMHRCENKNSEKKVLAHRYCAVCDSTFLSVIEKKAHKCPFEDPSDPKYVKCRFCGKRLLKLIYARHAENTHSEKKHICLVCELPLPTKQGLKSKNYLFHLI